MISTNVMESKVNSGITVTSPKVATKGVANEVPLPEAYDSSLHVVTISTPGAQNSM